MESTALIRLFFFSLFGSFFVLMDKGAAPFAPGRVGWKPRRAAIELCPPPAGFPFGEVSTAPLSPPASPFGDADPPFDLPDGVAFIVIDAEGEGTVSAALAGP
mmetsp:Transcript_31681/g.75558  ORF Transcript_31681/g.75558 Transcript_31681/m.75558 type:complete len:103 (-) Transcript_31681:286-594(-)